MGININARTDYSYLFSSMGGRNNNANNIFSMTGLFADYASIKNGSYGKVLKAYYAEGDNHAVKDMVQKKESNRNAVTRDDAQKLNKVQTATDSLKESADKLLETGKDSLFRQKEITTTDAEGVESTKKDYDRNAIYSAVNDLVKNYNSVLDMADSAKNTTVTGRVESLTNKTMDNEKALGKIGITVGKDGTLSVNKEAFMKADMSSVKNLFNGSGSYGYQVSAQASLINYSAEREASKASTYNVNGHYNSVLNTGNLYNSYF